MQRNISGCWPIYSDLYCCIRSSHNWMRRFTLFGAECGAESHCSWPFPSRLFAAPGSESSLFFRHWNFYVDSSMATLRLGICGGFNRVSKCLQVCYSSFFTLEQYGLQYDCTVYRSSLLLFYCIFLRLLFSSLSNICP